MAGIAGDFSLVLAMNAAHSMFLMACDTPGRVRSVARATRCRLMVVLSVDLTCRMLVAFTASTVRFPQMMRRLAVTCVACLVPRFYLFCPGHIPSGQYGMTDIAARRESESRNILFVFRFQLARVAIARKTTRKR